MKGGGTTCPSGAWLNPQKGKLFELSATWIIKADTKFQVTEVSVDVRQRGCSALNVHSADEHSESSWSARSSSEAAAQESTKRTRSIIAKIYSWRGGELRQEKLVMHQGNSSR